MLAHSSEWLFGPDAPYERTGDVGQVVFPCGWLLDDDGDTIACTTAPPTRPCAWPPRASQLLDWLSDHPP